MKKKGKAVVKPLEMNRQFVQAFNWLRANEEIKTAQDLADRLDCSPAAISNIINYKKPLSEAYELRMNKLLAQYDPPLSLKDFDTDYLSRQLTLAGKAPTPTELVSLLATKITYLEASVLAVLEKLSKVEMQMTELLQHSKKAKN